ncbi:MAG: fatty acid desaturase family protein [Bacteriovoracaceae bacterium]|nr:fatty acid desaturase family protein [Bacteriovoracaceae bacterium]
MSVAETLAPLPREELQNLLKKSDVRGWASVLTNYSILSLAIFAALRFPSIWIWIVASILIAGRQLGLAILMHDCAHGSLFKSSRLNIFFGRWLCAAPVMADLDRYRTYHLEHHRTAGSAADPDRSNYQGYPVSRKSFLRKCLRDLCGLTGIKIFIMVIKMNAGVVKYQLAYDGEKRMSPLSLSEQLKNLIKGLYPSFVFHSLLFTLFFLLGHPWVYGLWWISWFTFYMLFSRIRNAAEHAATIDINNLDPLKNTRTTLANFLERLTVAPNHVNYHLEHHLLATIPPHALSSFHKLLQEHGILKKSKIAKSYREVISDLVKSR